MTNCNKIITAAEYIITDTTVFITGIERVITDSMGFITAIERVYHRQAQKNGKAKSAFPFLQLITYSNKPMHTAHIVLLQ